jgi:hypothetical protein
MPGVLEVLRVREVPGGRLEVLDMLGIAAPRPLLASALLQRQRNA